MPRPDTSALALATSTRHLLHTSFVASISWSQSIIRVILVAVLTPFTSGDATLCEARSSSYIAVCQLGKARLGLIRVFMVLIVVVRLRLGLKG